MQPDGDAAPTRHEVYDDLRPMLLAVAYQMLGSVGDAEDIVQEAFIRFHRETESGRAIESPRAWLSTVTTRLAINHLRSARVRREQYVGTWLPEPLLTDRAPDAAAHAETADELSMAFLVLLERLSPVERAVFLLHDVFAYEYDEIAVIVGKSEDNCRQIAHRARGHIDARRPRFEASRQRRQELARRFFEAAGAGDQQGLIAMLAEDAVAYSDGGGAKRTFLNPIYGRDKVALLMANVRGWVEGLGAVTARATEVNGQPGVLYVDVDGRAVVVISLDIAEGSVQAIRTVTNPEKLLHLNPA